MIRYASVLSVRRAETACGNVAREPVEAPSYGSHPVTLQAKMLRLELLNVKADLERELGRLVLTAARAVNGFTGSPVLACLRDIGRTGSPRRTASL